MAAILSGDRSKMSASAVTSATEESLTLRRSEVDPPGVVATVGGPPAVTPPSMPPPGVGNPP
eukprot:2879809-Alexandrium_andersonii.AAC.1